MTLAPPADLAAAEDWVREEIIDLKNVMPQDVVPDARLVQDLGLDSLDVVELKLSADQAFDLDIPDAELERATTVRGFAEMVYARTEPLRSAAVARAAEAAE